VDADLRHSTLAALFGVSPGPGLTDVLRRDAALDDVLLPVGAAMPGLGDIFGLDVANATGQHANGSNGNGHNGHRSRNAVSLLLAGREPANPQAVLASDRIVEVLDELQRTHDLVLIDSAPLLAVADTVPLLRYADSAIFVGRLGVTTRDTAKRLVEFLARVPDVHVVGIVANDLSRLEATGYGYGYGYGSYGDGAPRARTLTRALRIKQRA
jgi:Mrp family chromosome partitioning ATPase